jgi:hypothetical protein
VRRADQLHMPIVLKSGSLNLLEPSGPVMGLLYLYLYIILLCVTLRSGSSEVGYDQIWFCKIAVSLILYFTSHVQCLLFCVLNYVFYVAEWVASSNI